MIVQVHNLLKEFGQITLFENVTFQINKGDKAALIGANGSGKTTLIKMMLGQSHINDGTVTFAKDITLGYLSQFTLSDKTTTLIEEINEVFQDIIALEESLHEVAQQLQKQPEEEGLLQQYGRLENQFQLVGGYQYHVEIDTILSVFGFSKEDYDRSISTFSGGEKTRVSLAKLLLTKPDLLILDEPTNHLDLKAVEFLEKFIKGYQKTVIIITHDKYFIQNVCTKIIELENKTSYQFNGNYDHYIIEKTKRYESELSRYKREQAEVKRLEDWITRNKAKASKAKTAKDREKKVAKLKQNQIEKPSQNTRSVGFKINDIYASDKILLRVNDITLGYETPLINHISFKMAYQDKLAIIGENGVGKTTLLKVLLEQMAPLKGGFRFTKKMKTGYLEQSHYDFNYNNTLFDEIRYYYPNYDNTKIRSILAQFLFYGEDVFTPINKLSGGELVRLALLKLMLEKVELLILDEPTNHLDLPTKDVIEDTLSSYSGPIIFVSHDRYFINKVATHILDLRDGKATLYVGNYDDYKQQIERMVEQKIKPKRSNHKKINYSSRAKQLENKIEELEGQLKELKQSLFLEEVYSDLEKYNQCEEMISEIENELKNLYSDYDLVLHKL